MSERRRINISVDIKTHQRLLQLQQQCRHKSLCELVVAFIHILLDRLEDAPDRRFDIPEYDGAYIDRMFDELAHVEPTPDGSVPVRHNTKRCE